MLGHGEKYDTDLTVKMLWHHEERKWLQLRKWLNLATGRPERKTHEVRVGRTLVWDGISRKDSEKLLFEPNFAGRQGEHRILWVKVAAWRCEKNMEYEATHEARGECLYTINKISYEACWRVYMVACGQTRAIRLFQKDHSAGSIDDKMKMKEVRAEELGGKLVMGIWNRGDNTQEERTK